MSIKLRIRNLEKHMPTKTCEHFISIIPDHGLFLDGVEITQAEYDSILKSTRFEQNYTIIRVIYDSANLI